MKYKKPKQDQSKADYKQKVMLLLTNLSAPTAEKFAAAMREAAGKVRYTGSPYHRSPGSKAGPVAQRAGLSSRCPASWTNQEATRVLRLAIIEGRISEAWTNAYPNFVWHLEGDVLYEARLTNAGNGEYHGYPLEDRWQWPRNYEPPETFL
jgi:hypothetical protein